MRLLFCSAQLPGHLDWGGYLLTAAELGRRGHTVRWVSGGAVRDAVEQAGVTFQELAETGWRWPPPPPLPAPAVSADPAWQQRRALRALDQWLDEPRVAAAVTELLVVAEKFQPDLIVTEMFVAAAGIVAERMGVPLIVAGWPALRSDTAPNSELGQIARGRLDRLLAQFGVHGVYWTAAGPPALRSTRLHLTYWSPSWYAGVALQPQTRHVGGSAEAGQALGAAPPLADEQVWALITLGTSFNDDPAFFVAAAHAASRMGCIPLVVFGRSAVAVRFAQWANRLPANAVVCERVVFGDVLPATAVALHHGGAGTTHAMVTHGVPQVIVPHAADQVHQALGATRSGVGLYIPAKQVTIDVLAAALADLLPDLSDYRRRAQALRSEFASLGGTARAADWVETVV
jgi:sterol 3beta-glucosyltransferase